jgi:hypothetical protein
MSDLSSPLDWGPISLIRRNHGLEHATINLLSKKYPARGFAGHSDSKGFWIIGEISTDELADIAQQALVRMIAGEHGLAIHAHCGTNAVTTGVVAGSVAWLATLRTENNWQKKLDRLPWIITLVTGAIILSQPLGPKVQEKVTTSGTPGNLVIKQIVRYESSFANHSAMHRVQTAEGHAKAEQAAE